MKYFKGLLLLLISGSALAVDPTLHWQTITTDHFEIHYAAGNESLASKAAAVAERVHNKLAPRLNWQPAEKTHLVLSDETDQPNGYAMPFPFSRSVLFVAPPDTTNTLEDFGDWLELLIKHEYTHILHLDKAGGGPSELRKLFGRHFLLFPNMFQPGWLTEGLATHYETNSAQGIGRGQSSLFAMMMRLEVAQGIKPVSQVNLPIRSWPMGTAHYLYGVYFYEFLSEQYGEVAINALIANYSNNIIPFMINTNTEQLFNKDISQLWDEFDIWLQNKFLAQISQLESQGVVSGERITQDGYFTSEINISPAGTIYYVRHGAFDHAMLMMIDQQGKHHALAEVHNRARIDINNNNDVLITQPEVCHEYNLYYDLYILKSGSTTLQRITHCARYRSASWLSDHSVVAVHIEKSISSLHKLNIDSNQAETLWTGDSTTVIGQPDISNDGKTLAASVFRQGHGWNIELLNLADMAWRKITDDQVIDMHPRFLADDAALLFSSERNNVYNIYRYDLNTGRISALTHELSGAFQPAQHDDTTALYYTGYNADGNDIYKLEQPTALTDEPLVTVPTTSNVPDTASYPAYPATDYSAWPSLTPRWWQPILLLTEDQTEFGFSTAGNDALGIHNYTLNLAWDATNNWATGSLAYAWRNRIIVGVQRETDILLDTNNQFAVARHNDDEFFIANFPYTQLDAAWNLALAAIGSQNSDGRRAVNIAPLADTQDNKLALAIGFNNSENYIRSISANAGRNVHLIAESSEVFSSDFSGEVYTLDWREYLPLGGQHVLALRLVEGYGTEQPEPFRLGGENTDFHFLDLLNGAGSLTLGQREYALRGYAEGHSALRGRRMQLTSAEWRFPIKLVERGYMAPPVGLMQLAGSVFADSGMAWQDTAGKAYTSVGAELHADTNLFYGITFKLRLGVARGLDDILGDERIYLSLGSSF
jgi:hypothetical protein